MVLTTDAAYHFAGDGLVRVTHERRSLECLVSFSACVYIFARIFVLLTRAFSVTFDGYFFQLTSFGGGRRNIEIEILVKNTNSIAAF